MGQYDFIRNIKTGDNNDKSIEVHSIKDVLAALDYMAEELIIKEQPEELPLGARQSAAQMTLASLIAESGNKLISNSGNLLPDVKIELSSRIPLTKELIDKTVAHLKLTIRDGVKVNLQTHEQMIDIIKPLYSKINQLMSLDNDIRKPLQELKISYEQLKDLVSSPEIKNLRTQADLTNKNEEAYEFEDLKQAAEALKVKGASGSTSFYDALVKCIQESPKLKTSFDGFAREANAQITHNFHDQIGLISNAVNSQDNPGSALKSAFGAVNEQEIRSVDRQAKMNKGLAVVAGLNVRDFVEALRAFHDKRLKNEKKAARKKEKNEKLTGKVTKLAFIKPGGNSTAADGTKLIAPTFTGESINPQNDNKLALNMLSSQSRRPAQNNTNSIADLKQVNTNLDEASSDGPTSVTRARGKYSWNILKGHGLPTNAAKTILAGPMSLVATAMSLVNAGKTSAVRDNNPRVHVQNSILDKGNVIIVPKKYDSSAVSPVISEIFESKQAIPLFTKRDPVTGSVSKESKLESEDGTLNEVVMNEPMIFTANQLLSDTGEAPANSAVSNLDADIPSADAVPANITVHESIDLQNINDSALIEEAERNVVDFNMNVTANSESSVNAEQATNVEINSNFISQLYAGVLELPTLPERGNFVLRKLTAQIEEFSKSPDFTFVGQDLLKLHELIASTQVYLQESFDKSIVSQEAENTAKEIEPKRADYSVALGVLKDSLDLHDSKTMKRERDEWRLWGERIISEALSKLEKADPQTLDINNFIDEVNTQVYASINALHKSYLVIKGAMEGAPDSKEVRLLNEFISNLKLDADSFSLADRLRAAYNAGKEKDSRRIDEPDVTPPTVSELVDGYMNKLEKNGHSELGAVEHKDGDDHISVITSRMSDVVKEDMQYVEMNVNRTDLSGSDQQKIANINEAIGLFKAKVENELYDDLSDKSSLARRESILEQALTKLNDDKNGPIDITQFTNEALAKVQLVMDEARHSYDSIVRSFGESKKNLDELYARKVLFDPATNSLNDELQSIRQSLLTAYKARPSDNPNAKKDSSASNVGALTKIFENLSDKNAAISAEQSQIEARISAGKQKNAALSAQFEAIRQQERKLEEALAEAKVKLADTRSGNEDLEKAASEHLENMKGLQSALADIQTTLQADQAKLSQIESERSNERSDLEGQISALLQEQNKLKAAIDDKGTVLGDVNNELLSNQAALDRARQLAAAIDEQTQQATDIKGQLSTSLDEITSLNERSKMELDKIKQEIEALEKDLAAARKEDELNKAKKEELDAAKAAQAEAQAAAAAARKTRPTLDGSDDLGRYLFTEKNPILAMDVALKTIPVLTSDVQPEKDWAAFVASRTKNLASLTGLSQLDDKAKQDALSKWFNVKNIAVDQAAITTAVEFYSGVKVEPGADKSYKVTVPQPRMLGDSPQRMVSFTVENGRISSDQANPSEDALALMVIEMAIQKRNTANKGFAIKDCEGDPQMALKIYLLGLQQGLAPRLTDPSPNEIAADPFCNAIFQEAQSLLKPSSNVTADINRLIQRVTQGLGPGIEISEQDALKVSVQAQNNPDTKPNPESKPVPTGQPAPPDRPVAATLTMSSVVATPTLTFRGGKNKLIVPNAPSKDGNQTDPSHRPGQGQTPSMT